MTTWSDDPGDDPDKLEKMQLAKMLDQQVDSGLNQLIDDYSTYKDRLDFDNPDDLNNAAMVEVFYTPSGYPMGQGALDSIENNISSGSTQNWKHGIKLNLRSGRFNVGASGYDSGSIVTNVAKSKSMSWAIDTPPTITCAKTVWYYVFYINVRAYKSYLLDLGREYKRPLWMPELCWDQDSKYIFAFPFVKPASLESQKN